MSLNWHRRQLRELDSRIETLSAELDRLRTEEHSARLDIEKEFWREKIVLLEAALLDAQREKDSFSGNITISEPVPAVFEEDVTPPIPDIKEGAFSFILNTCWWMVYIAMNLIGYAVMIWFVWTVLTA